jgi:hypothetical protein
MELDWIIQQPIDFEYKQYLILDYVKKAEEKLERFELYPTFQELSLLYSSAQRVLDHGQFITFKREPEEGDDEILLIDLIYNTIRFKDDEEGEEIIKCAEFASEKFKDLFMVAKSLWSIVNDSISVGKIVNEKSVTVGKRGNGFFHFTYGGELYVYQFNIRRMVNTTDHNKTFTQRIYQGEQKDLQYIIDNFNIFDRNSDLYPECESWDDEKRLKRIENSPIFEMVINQDFPLEGCLLSLIKRKLMSYIFQSVRIKDLKDN